MHSNATKTFASGLADANNSIKRALQAKAILTANRKQLGKLLRTLDRLGVEDLSVGSDPWANRARVNIQLRDLESFKDAKLVAVLEYVAVFTEHSTSKDWAQYLNRDFTFTSKTIDISISAYVKEDSPTCRKVVVGTELQTVEKYKIVCSYHPSQQNTFTGKLTEKMFDSIFKTALKLAS